MESADTIRMQDTRDLDDECDVRMRHGRRRHRCDARKMLAAALGTGPAVVGRAPGRRAAGGAVLVGPVILAFGRYTAGSRCRLAAAVRWLHEHGAGRVDVVLRDAGESAPGRLAVRGRRSPAAVNRR